MRKDITNSDDLYLIVKLFYVKLMKDEKMKSFFVEFENPELLEEHLKILVNFWDNILFYSGGYRKNAMLPHIQLHQKTPLKNEHFKRWLSMFNGAVDELFEGENSTAIKSRALSIATVMEIKISQMND